MITREWILEQIKLYESQRDNAFNVANANQGALEAMKAALDEFDKEIENPKKEVEKK